MELIIIDCEASGLEEESYPIEIGVAFPYDSFGFLIKPHHSWSYWNEDSAKIHNIERDKLDSGLSVYDSVIKLNSQLRDSVVFSDAVDYEIFWIDKLFDVVGVERLFDIRSIYQIDFDFDNYKKIKKIKSQNIQIHRAENDACLIRDSILESLNY